MPPSPQFFPKHLPTVSDNEARREYGRDIVASTVVWMLSRNGWSHPNFVALCDWALNEQGSIHTSQLSHIRNGRMRMMGLKTLDGLGAVNLALWCYHNDRKALRKVTPVPPTPQIEDLLKNAEPILNPITGEPLDQGGWMLLYLGYLKLPGIDPIDHQSQLEPAELAKVLGTVLAQYLEQSQVSFSRFAQVVQEQMGDSPHNAQKLISVAAGIDRYRVTEVGQQLIQIGQVMEAIDPDQRSASELVTHMKREAIRTLNV